MRVPPFNSGSSQSGPAVKDSANLANYENMRKKIGLQCRLVLRFLANCNGCVDNVNIEDIAKYPKVSMKIRSQPRMGKQCSELNVQEIKIDDREAFGLAIESHIDQLGFLLRNTKPGNLTTVLPIDTTIDVIREFYGNGEWLNEIQKKTFTITDLDDCTYWKELRIARTYRMINSLVKTLTNISKISIGPNSIRLSTGALESLKSAVFNFEVAGTITKERLHKILGLSSCISGVRLTIDVPLPWLGNGVPSQCLDSLGVIYKRNPSYSPPCYAHFRYLSLGPIAIALD